MDLQGLQTGAKAASDELSSLQGGAPSMLAALKQNLVSIYAKDNPLMQERNQALSTFLSTPNNTRASLLPGNLPQVEGSNLNLSPTQQNAIVGARSNAALAPLLGLNQAVTAGYGTIGDIVQGAAGDLQARVQAAQTKAQNAMELYKQAVQEDQFARQEARLSKTAGSGTGDLSGLLAAILGSQQENQTGVGKPDPAQFDEIEQGQSFTGPVSQQIQALPSSGISFGLPDLGGLAGGGGERLKAWGNTIFGGLTGNYGKF